MRWVVEPVFGSGFDLSAAARARGHEVIAWRDEWWGGGWPALDGPALFHGSLGNADRIRRELPWRPGSLCDAEAFRCSSWYARAERWLLNRGAIFTTAERLVAEPPPWDAVFVRPDSALKPFSGRVVRRGQLSLAALDHGFYYDDPALPVVAAPVRPVDREWRFLVVERRVVAGSGYEADGRRATADDGVATRFAEEIAEALDPPEAVYALDVGLSAGELRLIELNPFSGADPYACDPAAVVAAVGAWAERCSG